MPQAKPGDTVRVHYTGTLRDGSVFDSSRGRSPLEFRLGSGQVIPGFDAAVSGMAIGEERTVTIAADEAYGPRRPDLVLTVDRAQLPAGFTPAVGQQLELGQGQDVFAVVVRDVSEDRVVFDANHPLAGEDLTFALELLEIR